MRKSIAAVLVTAAAIATAGCGHDGASSGPTTSRNFQVGSFDKIEVAGPYTVQVRTGAGPSASARGPQEMVEHVVVEVKDGTLEIHPRDNHGFSFHWGNRDGHVEVAVTVPALSAAAVAGSGDVAVDHVRGDAFDGDVAGSGSVTLGSVEVKELKLSIGGSGDIKAAAGTAQSAEYEISGSGGIDAGGLTAEKAKVSIAGSGSAKARATGSAEVSIAGSGDVDISGGAKCKIDKVGSGDVRCS